MKLWAHYTYAGGRKHVKALYDSPAARNLRMDLVGLRPDISVVSILIPDGRQILTAKGIVLPFKTRRSA